MAASAVTLASSAHADSCPPGIVSVNLTSVDDVREFVDALRCTGEGVFDVTWNGRLQIDQRIEISGRKNVTVTGSHGTTSDSTSDDHAVIDAGETTGIFLVTNMSTLALHYLHLEGGLSEYDGGAVEVKSSSSLYVFGCDFTNNTCSEGGEPTIYGIPGTWYFILRSLATRMSNLALPCSTASTTTTRCPTIAREFPRKDPIKHYKERKCIGSLGCHAHIIERLTPLRRHTLKRGKLATKNHR